MQRTKYKKTYQKKIKLRRSSLLRIRKKCLLII